MSGLGRALHRINHCIEGVARCWLQFTTAKTTNRGLALGETRSQAARERRAIYSEMYLAPYYGYGGFGVQEYLLRTKGWSLNCDWASKLEAKARWLLIAMISLLRLIGCGSVEILEYCLVDEGIFIDMIGWKCLLSACLFLITSLVRLHSISSYVFQ